jgi:hypothetical protein
MTLLQPLPFKTNELRCNCIHASAPVHSVHMSKALACSKLQHPIHTIHQHTPGYQQHPKRV